MNDEKERRERMMDSQRDYGDETRDEPVIGLWARRVSLGELSAAERRRFETMRAALRERPHLDLKMARPGPGKTVMLVD